ncbi:uncharacterized protein LOC101849903 [Aplysia californica]|uniref:Uncharacterized protein LOC101849903 n=1 Tax=Aplysia californica TaxID=6500 RepID=A0ABM0JEI0_APLCA|nr:uncharacterized protein LOC101849903 [Aplysia californica]
MERLSLCSSERAADKMKSRDCPSRHKVPDETTHTRPTHPCTTSSRRQDEQKENRHYKTLISQTSDMSGADASIKEAPDFAEVMKAKSIMSAMRQAVRNGALPVVEKLLPVVRHSILPVSKYLGGNSFDNVILADAVELGHCDVIKILINGGGSPDGVVRGESHVNRAIRSQKQEALKILLDLGANISTSAAQGAGKSALHRAAAHGTGAIVCCLLDFGADIEERDRVHGNTPLHDACAYCNGDAALALFKRGAEFNAVNQMGKTPLAKLLETVTRADDFTNRSRLDLAEELVRLGFAIPVNTTTKTLTVGTANTTARRGGHVKGRTLRSRQTAVLGEKIECHGLLEKSIYNNNGDSNTKSPRDTDTTKNDTPNNCGSKRKQSWRKGAASYTTSVSGSTQLTEFSQQGEIIPSGCSVSGEPIAFPTKENKLYQLYLSILRQASCSLTLQENCRLTIVRSIEGPLRPAIKELGLPKILQRYVLLGNQDDCL